jgi:hypothetical protein
MRAYKRQRPGWLPCSLRLEMLEDRLVPTLLGNQLFPSDNPWNENITNAPVAANSATLVASIGLGSNLHPDFGAGTYAGSYIGIPFNVVSGTQPKIHVVIDAYASESDLLPIPIPSNAVIEGDPLPSSQNTGDRHLLVYDKDNNIVYETFNTHRPSEEPDGQWHADAEAVWDLNKDTFRTAGYTSADAAGLPILPGLVRPDEVLDQHLINHALRFTVPASRDAYIYPASHQAGVNDSTLPRMGERFRLRASFDISGYSPADQVILQALKDYGMIVADNGSGWYISGLNVFVNFLGSGGTPEQAQSLIAGSAEYFQNRGGGTNDGFLTALYQDALGRAADPAGRSAFDQALASGATPTQVAAAIFASDEYRHDLVQGFYLRYLHRPADAGGLSAFVNALKAGARDQDVIAAILASGEYSATL